MPPSLASNFIGMVLWVVTVDGVHCSLVAHVTKTISMRSGDSMVSFDDDVKVEKCGIHLM